MSLELLATGTGEASSAGIVMAWGEQMFVFLKDVNGGLVTRCTVYVEVEDSALNWNIQNTLTPDNPGAVIAAKGKWRVRRAAGGDAVGVEYEK